MVSRRQHGGAGHLKIADPATNPGHDQNADQALDFRKPNAFNGIETPMGGDDEKFSRFCLPHWPGHDLGA